jgi:hypothetical protein
MQAPGGVRIYVAVLIVDLGSRGGEWLASLPGRFLPPGKETAILIGLDAVWISELVWMQRLVEEIYCLYRGSNPCLPVFSRKLY